MTDRMDTLRALVYERALNLATTPGLPFDNSDLERVEKFGRGEGKLDGTILMYRDAFAASCQDIRVHFDLDFIQAARGEPEAAITTLEGGEYPVLLRIRPTCVERGGRVQSPRAAEGT